MKNWVLFWALCVIYVGCERLGYVLGLEATLGVRETGGERLGSLLDLVLGVEKCMAGVYCWAALGAVALQLVSVGKFRIGSRTWTRRNRLSGIYDRRISRRSFPHPACLNVGDMPGRFELHQSDSSNVQRLLSVCSKRK